MSKWYRIWSMKYLVHIEAEVRNLSLRYQVMAGMALWGKVEQNWPKVAYNGPIYVLVAGYDKFWPYSACITSFDQFRCLPSGLITLRSRCQVSVYWPEMFNNEKICPVVARYVHLWPYLIQRSSFWSILKNWVLIWLHMSFAAKECQTLHNTASNGSV